MIQFPPSLLSILSEAINTFCKSGEGDVFEGLGCGSYGIELASACQQTELLERSFRLGTERGEGEGVEENMGVDGFLSEETHNVEVNLLSLIMKLRSRLSQTKYVKKSMINTFGQSIRA